MIFKVETRVETQKKKEEIGGKSHNSDNPKKPCFNWSFLYRNFRIVGPKVDCLMWENNPIKLFLNKYFLD